MHRVAVVLALAASSGLARGCDTRSPRASSCSEALRTALVDARVEVEDASSAPPPRPRVAWAEKLDPITFRDVSTGETVSVRLYDPTGQVDPDAVAAIDHLLSSDKAAALARAEGAPSTLDTRLLQLVVKAATRFDATEVEVVSAFRASKRRGSRHRTGKAMDFVLPGVPAARLAASLRREARAGVGVYTHPRTQFVHLDVRDESYHWLDASPPGRVWREARLLDPGGPARDAAYAPEQDLPISVIAAASAAR